jgi:hypothetical protein
LNGSYALKNDALMAKILSKRVRHNVISMISFCHNKVYGMKIIINRSRISETGMAVYAIKMMHEEYERVRQYIKCSMYAAVAVYAIKNNAFKVRTGTAGYNF